MQFKWTPNLWTFHVFLLCFYFFSSIGNAIFWEKNFFLSHNEWKAIIWRQGTGMEIMFRKLIDNSVVLETCFLVIWGRWFLKWSLFCSITSRFFKNSNVQFSKFPVLSPFLIDRFRFIKCKHMQGDCHNVEMSFKVMQRTKMETEVIIVNK